MEARQPTLSMEARQPTLSMEARQPTSSVQPVRSAQKPDAESVRVRVSVRTSARDGTLLVVRTLAEGQTPPPGTREAFLVMTESATDAPYAKGGVA